MVQKYAAAAAAAVPVESKEESKRSFAKSKLILIAGGKFGVQVAHPSLF